ncbi:MAG: sigma-54 dependent transcriptional regulator [Desulforhopalus sp.]|nr:sigma-54 dependent transcriptional regulator [Desulforhopalus sp.]
MKGHILIIEDDQDMGEMLDAGLSRRGFTTLSLPSGQAGIEAIPGEQPDVLLTDINLPDINGIQICREVAEKWPEIPVIMMTAFGSLDTAIEAIRAGAYDFITKPLDMDLLSLTLLRAVDHRNLKRQVQILSAKIERSHTFPRLIGESSIMKEFFVRLQRIADTETSVLITGDSGVGKEITARTLHDYSRRKGGPFVAINCSALPENLLESELFGHVKGAFTNAWQDRTGLLLEASGGTLFLDEVGDIPISLQPKLLRALEERTVRPVGGNREKAFDARIIAATHIDIEAAVAEGRFREDLYYRLNVIKVDIPPLRARGSDILLLAQKFIGDFAEKLCKPVTGLADSTIKRLLQYQWPGNVRELRNAMEHGVAMTLFEKIVPEDLPQKIQDHTGRTLFWETAAPPELISLEEMIQRYIAYILKTTKGNQSLAAEVLRIDRKTLYRRLQKPTE